MIHRFLADVTLVVHLAFIVFVVAGGLLALRWPRVAWVHLPAAIWGMLIAMIGWTCPLTPLEQHLRRLGGQAGYADSFIERYLLPVIYPGGTLPRAGFVALGAFVLVVNIAVYAWVWRRRRAEAGAPTGVGEA